MVSIINISKWVAVTVSLTAMSLAVIGMTIIPAFAQDMIVGNISAEEETINATDTGGPQNYQSVERAEVIDSDGNVQNPGGAGNENIDIDETESMTSPTNLEEAVLPETSRSQQYQDFKISLQALEYAIADMQYTVKYGTDVEVVIVRGMDGVMTQPNIMDLDTVGRQYGYVLATHLPIGGAWETTFEKPITGGGVSN